MTPAKRQKSSKEQSKKDKKIRRVRFDLSITQILMCGFTFVFILAWMFFFGILVGRGIPLVESEDASLKAQILRFMGLGKKASVLVENASETWEDPDKMLESLTYYESLVHKRRPVSGKRTSKEAPKSEAAPDSESATSGKKGSDEAQFNPQASEAPKTASGYYTLLAASLKNPQNAERLVKQLKQKGYSPRMEALEMPETGRWTRVLVGSFETREEAQRFAAEFNRKEKLQGMVIRLNR